ncbi:MAG: tetratricopeptide repeat protein, partial [Candidatus Eremiobacterota bacterium]
AIEIDENYPEPHKNLGIIYFHEQDWFMCRKELEKAIEINPDYLDAYIYLGKLFKMRNMRDKAENAFYRAWDLANKKSDVKAREEIKKELQELKR